MAAMQYKLEGNRLFSLKKYEEAIKQYTKAINKNATTAVFFTNRALCNLKLQRWQEGLLEQWDRKLIKSMDNRKVLNDCKTAIEHDSQSVKGYFFMGQSDVELEHYEDAILHLTKAYDLARQQKLNFGDDIAAMLRLAKKRKWERAEQERIQQEIELQSYLNHLIDNDKQKELEKSRKELETLKKKDGEELKDTIEAKFEKRKQELNSIFVKVDERRKMRDVPDYLCGKISFEIMKDPVITPSGITYDRKDIEEHLQRVGHFDPVTRNQLKINQLIPNLAMREVIGNFVEQNEWVEDY